MSNLVIVGAQWGDEGKGKLVDLLSKDMDFIVRFQGGNNAGHTVIAGGEQYILHLIPSGILHPGKVCLIGNGVVLDPTVFCQEMDTLAAKGVDVSPARLKISYKTHIIMPYHKALDIAREKAKSDANRIGTTGRGIGPCYEDRVCRTGIRAADLCEPDILRRKIELALPEKNALLAMYGKPCLDANAVFDEVMASGSRLIAHLTDVTSEIMDGAAAGKNIMFEGAQGVHLDVDHGTYPFVTSSNTVASNAAAGCGVPASMLDRVMGIVKAYTTRVGTGPFPTELFDETGKHLQQCGAEVGATTGRVRRCGWLDAVLLRETVRLCGLTEIAFTKLDVLTGLDTIKIATAYEYKGKQYLYPPQMHNALAQAVPVYEALPGWSTPLRHINKWEDLPAPVQTYVRRIEELVGVPVTIVSVGPDREETFSRKSGD